jgi:hypothetical protein
MYDLSLVPKSSIRLVLKVLVDMEPAEISGYFPEFLN